VGHAVDKDVLNIIASRDEVRRSKLLYTLEDYQALNGQLARELQLSLCDGIYEGIIGYMQYFLMYSIIPYCGRLTV